MSTAAQAAKSKSELYLGTIVSTDAIHTGTNAKCLCPWKMVSDLGYIEHCDSSRFDILSSLSSNLSSSSFPSTCHFGQKGFLPWSAPCISVPARYTTLILIFPLRSRFLTLSGLDAS